MDIIKKRITTFVLKKYINPYLESSLTTDQLEKANFGTLSINDLELSPLVLNEYFEGLPLKVIGGSIGNIKIGIIVTALKITVELSQLDILLGFTTPTDSENKKKEETKVEIDINKIIEKNVEELQAEEEEIFNSNSKKNQENLSSRQLLSNSLETTINNVSIKINQMRIRIQKYNKQINKNTALVLSIPQISIESINKAEKKQRSEEIINLKKRILFSNEFQILLYKSKKEDIHMVHSKRILLFDSPKINLKNIEHTYMDLYVDGPEIIFDAHFKALRGALNPNLLAILFDFFPLDYFNVNNDSLASNPPSPPPVKLTQDLYSSIFKSSLETTSGIGGIEEENFEFHDCDEDIGDDLFHDCDEDNHGKTMEEERNNTESIIFQSMTASISSIPKIKKNSITLNMTIYQISLSFLYENNKTNQIFKHAWEGNKMKPPPYSIHDHFTLFLSGFTCSYINFQDHDHIRLFWNSMGLVEYFFKNFNKNNLEYCQKKKNSSHGICWEDLFYIESDFYSNELLTNSMDPSSKDGSAAANYYLSECKNEITYQRVFNQVQIMLHLSRYHLQLSDEFLLFSKNYLFVFYEFFDKYSRECTNRSQNGVNNVPSPSLGPKQPEIIYIFNASIDPFSIRIKNHENFYLELSKLKKQIVNFNLQASRIDKNTLFEEIHEFTKKYSEINSETGTEKIVIDFEPFPNESMILSPNFPNKLQISLSSITVSIQPKNSKTPEAIFYLNSRSTGKQIFQKVPITVEFCPELLDFDISALQNQFMDSDSEDNLIIDINSEYSQFQPMKNSFAYANRQEPTIRKYRKTPIVKLKSVIEGQSQNPQILSEQDLSSFKATGFDFSTCKITCAFPYLYFNASENGFHFFTGFIQQFIANSLSHFSNFQNEFNEKQPGKRKEEGKREINQQHTSRSGLFIEFTVNEGKFQCYVNPTDKNQDLVKFELDIDEFKSFYSSNYLFFNKSYLYSQLTQLQLTKVTSTKPGSYASGMNDSSGAIPPSSGTNDKSILISSLSPPNGTSFISKPPVLVNLIELLPNGKTNIIVTLNQLFLQYQLGALWPQQLSNFFLPPSPSSPAIPSPAPPVASSSMDIDCYFNVCDCSGLYLPFDPSCFEGGVSKCLVTTTFQASSNIRSFDNFQLNARFSDVIIYLSNMNFTDSELLSFTPTSNSQVSFSSCGITRIEQLGFLKVANLGVLKLTCDYDSPLNQIKVKLSNISSVILLYQDAYTKLMPLYNDYSLFSTPIDPFFHIVTDALPTDNESKNYDYNELSINPSLMESVFVPSSSQGGMKSNNNSDFHSLSQSNGATTTEVVHQGNDISFPSFDFVPSIRAVPSSPLFNLEFENKLKVEMQPPNLRPTPNDDVFSFNPRLERTISAFDEPLPISLQPPQSPVVTTVKSEPFFSNNNNISGNNHGPFFAPTNQSVHTPFSPPTPSSPFANPYPIQSPFANQINPLQQQDYNPPSSPFQHQSAPPSPFQQPSSPGPFQQQSGAPSLFQHPQGSLQRQGSSPFLQQPLQQQQQQYGQSPSPFPQQQDGGSFHHQNNNNQMIQPGPFSINNNYERNERSGRGMEIQEEGRRGGEEWGMKKEEKEEEEENNDEFKRLLMEDKLSKVVNYRELTEEERKDCIIMEVAFDENQSKASPFLFQQQQNQQKQEAEEKIKKNKVMDDEFVLIKKQSKVRINKEILRDLKEQEGGFGSNKKPYLGVTIIDDYKNTNYKNNIFILPKDYPKFNVQFTLEQFSVQITLFDTDQPNEYLKKSSNVSEKEDLSADSTPIPGKVDRGDEKDNIEIKLSKIQMQFYLFDSKSKNWRMAVGIREIEINDNIFTSKRNKFMCYDPKWLRYLDSNMIQLLMEQNSYSLNELNLSSSQYFSMAQQGVPSDYLVPKLMLKLSVLPLRLFVDQDSKEFLYNFLTQKIAYSNNAPQAGSIYEEIQISDIPIRVDYKAKSIDLINFDFLEILNWCSLKGAKFKLQKVTIRNKKPEDVLAEITKQWKSYLRAYALGLGPVAAVKNIASGVSKLVTVPYEYYTEKDGKLILGMKKGTTEFSRTVGYELLNIGAGVTTAFQKGLEFTDGLIDYTRPEDLQNVVNTNRNTFSQPESTVEGLKQGLVVLKNAGTVFQKCLIAVPKEQYDKNGINGFVNAAVHAIPVMLITPLKATGESVGIILNGAANSLKGEGAEMKLKYKPN